MKFPSVYRRDFPDRRLARALVCAALACAMNAPPAVWAERADREKPVNLEADRVDLDDAKKEAVFEGKATLTPGTPPIKALPIIVKQDPDRFPYPIAYCRPAHFP